MPKTESNTIQYTARDLVIIDKDLFPIMDRYPIEQISDSVYRRIEKLACWFVLRAPMTEVTRLANPSLIDLFKTDIDPKRGARSINKSELEKAFLVPLDLDCTQFEFVYTRMSVRCQLIEKRLIANDETVFSDRTERCVCFVGKNGAGKEDSCIESICRHVRNGFAHGRIAIENDNDDPLIFIEDGATPRNVDYEGEKHFGQKLEIRFRMVIKLSTLELIYQMLMDDGARL